MHNKGNYKQGEEKAFKMRENNSKQKNDKELISKIYKQLMMLNTRKIKDTVKKRTKELNRYFSKEDIQMANKHMKDAQHHSLSEKCKSKPHEVPSHPSQNGCHQKVYKQ